jgi:ubiquinone/menaquinone biosynthesis C-methylase UbiE
MTSSAIQSKPGNWFDKKGAGRFSRIAEEIFAPIYPVLAEYICRETGVSAGACVDVGAGPGHLGLALAGQHPDLQVILYDASADMLELARENSHSGGFAERVRVQCGPAERLPFDDQSVQLVVSRGSIFFWDDQVQGINEIYRILALGGCACVGGGFGGAALLAEVQRKMDALDPSWNQKREERMGAQGASHFHRVMEASAVPDYQISKTEAGLWIHFRK